MVVMVAGEERPLNMGRGSGEESQRVESRRRGRGSETLFGIQQPATLVKHMHM